MRGLNFLYLLKKKQVQTKQSIAVKVGIALMRLSLQAQRACAAWMNGRAARLRPKQQFQTWVLFVLLGSAYNGFLIINSLFLGGSMQLLRQHSTTTQHSFSLPKAMGKPDKRESSWLELQRTRQTNRYLDSLNKGRERNSYSPK